MAITPDTPGFTSYGGRTACTCLAQWLPVLERLAQHRGILDGDLTITQMTGRAAASAGTHKEGGAVDWLETIRALVDLAREMGGASWIRLRPAFDIDHTHTVLNGCAHNGPARYQVTAYLAGFNGLGKGGRGGRETDEPRKLRTWREGITWAKAQLENTPTEEDDDMSKYEDQLDEILTLTKRTDARVLTTQGAVEKIHGLVAGVAKAIPNMSRWIGYLMKGVEGQGASLVALRAQVDAALEQSSDPSVRADLERIAGELDAVIDKVGA
ncbi:hypothetical protein [Nocardioides alkalitolerans]|uniref:hypothetical protein n=1 Tax=Nocardioides alkalitolerans TaxID=281714 RepID=UPI000412E04A|nr:hypothetical protein [Nocardioides alkalitolerans]